MGIDLTSGTATFDQDSVGRLSVLGPEGAFTLQLVLRYGDPQGTEHTILSGLVGLDLLLGDGRLLLRDTRDTHTPVADLPPPGDAVHVQITYSPSDGRSVTTHIDGRETSLITGMGLGDTSSLGLGPFPGSLRQIRLHGETLPPQPVPEPPEIPTSLELTATLTEPCLSLIHI